MHLPVPPRPGPRHLVNVVGEALVPVDVGDGNQLGQGDKGEAHGAVAVKQGQPVLAGAGSEQNADEKAEETSGT